MHATSPSILLSGGTTCPRLPAAARLSSAAGSSIRLTTTTALPANARRLGAAATIGSGIARGFVAAAAADTRRRYQRRRKHHEGQSTHALHLLAYGGQAVKLEGQFPIKMLHWNVGVHRDAI